LYKRVKISSTETQDALWNGLSQIVLENIIIIIIISITQEILIFRNMLNVNFLLK